MDKKGFKFNKLIGFNVYTIALVLIVFLSGVGLTYAYYAFSYEEESVIVGNVINVDIDLEVDLVVGTNEEMVPLNDAALSNAINGVGSTNGACVDNVGNLSCQVYKITLINSGSRVKHINGTIELYAKEGEGNVYNNLKWRELTNPTTVKIGSVVNGMEESFLVTDLTMESKTDKVWYIAVWISETDNDQRETDKGLFGGTVTFEAGSVIKASDYIINKYNDGSAITAVNIGGNSSKPQVHLNATQGIMLDNNGDYRYYGADPNNYVSYNDELWRIISVGNVKSSSTDTTGETRVKIVKADILTDDNGLNKYSYDSSASTVNSGEGVNDWSKADLMTELNTLYFNSTSGTCYTGMRNKTTACNFTNTGLSAEARTLTEDALYYLGGISGNAGEYANDYYTFERGTKVWGLTSSQTCNDGACPRATTWTGRVGIFYPSDYAYATDLNVCTKDGANYEDDENCKDNNWLFISSGINYLWYITPYPYGAKGGSLLYSAGNVIDGHAQVYYSFLVLPVQYLKSSVKIIDGEGTDEKPYILGI